MREELHYFDTEEFRKTQKRWWNRVLWTERYLSTRPRVQINPVIVNREDLELMYDWMVNNLEGRFYFRGHGKVYFIKKADAAKFKEEWGAPDDLDIEG